MSGSRLKRIQAIVLLSVERASVVFGHGDKYLELLERDVERLGARWHPPPTGTAAAGGGAAR